MDFFTKAKSVRLQSHHHKFLTADPDQETVIQDRNGTSKTVKWDVEFVDDVENLIRLKSIFGKYLTATEEQLVLGVTGRKAKQTMPKKLNPSIEWEPIKEGKFVRLKSRYGDFLRANAGLPPWRNSITHDIPHRHTDWILWEVDLIELRPEPPKIQAEPPRKIRTDPPKKVAEPEPVEDDSSMFTLTTPGFSPGKSFDKADSSSPTMSRTVYYKVVDEDGNVDEHEESSFIFKGHGLEELAEKLGEITGHDNVVICSRNKFNGQLYPLRLSLPPNSATMHIVVVPSTSKVAGDFISEVW